MVMMTPTGPQGPWKAEVIPVRGVAQRGVDGPQQEKKIKNLPKDAYATPTCSSKQNAAANDEDSPEKAAKLKAKKNLETTQNIGTDLLSSTSIDDSTIFF